MFDVRRSPELQAAVLALKTADREIKRDLNRDARTQLGPVWVRAVSAHTRSRAEQAVQGAGPKVSVGDRRVRVQAATRRRALSGGLVPADQYAGFEWGMTPREREVRARSPRGKSYTKRVLVGRQFHRRTKEGQVAMRAAGDVGPAIVSAWLRVIVGHFAAAYEVRR